MDKIPCVSKKCVDAEKVFPSFSVNYVDENVARLSCLEENVLIGSSKLPFKDYLTIRCTKSNGKLPAWKVENASLQAQWEWKFMERFNPPYSPFKMALKHRQEEMKN